jgi:hypothetical protein
MCFPLRIACCSAILATSVASCRTVPGRDVRYEPTPMAVVRAMLELAGAGPADVVYDLGSGDGRMVITAAREFGARGVGVEIDPKLVERARRNAVDAGVADRVEFRTGDMYEADVRPATVVTLFLHPQPNLKLRPKLRADLRPGARVVSYIWNMGDWAPDEARVVNRRRQIFLWRVPAPTLSRRHAADGWMSPDPAAHTPPIGDVVAEHGGTRGE